jgi:CRISPR-associated exonuclease Cas4
MQEITGTLIWYYYICKREVWLMAHNILPDEDDENIDYGRFLHEHSFERKDKEISFGNVKFDLLYKNGNELIIGETKKSSKFQEASKMQLLYYLLQLSYSGIKAKGVLHYPEEKKKINVELNNEAVDKLNTVKFEIEKILEKETPPLVEEIPFCKNCGYREYCYS